QVPGKIEEARGKLPADPVGARSAVAVAANLLEQAQGLVRDDVLARETAASLLRQAEEQVAAAEVQISAAGSREFSEYVYGHGTVTSAVSDRDLKKASKLAREATEHLQAARRELGVQDYEECVHQANQATDSARAASEKVAEAVRKAESDLSREVDRAERRAADLRRRQEEAEARAAAEAARWRSSYDYDYDSSSREDSSSRRDDDGGSSWSWGGSDDSGGGSSWNWGSGGSSDSGSSGGGWSGGGDSGSTGGGW
ncbi:MAG: hypothetical protein AB1758_22770, partial [Candidatus Eremiobacterota bacterium]